MAIETGPGDKVYSPDLVPFDLGGSSGLFGTVASLLVGPVRLLTRVMHNIVILPANLMASYASGLLVVGIILSVVGAADLLVYRRWPLLASQLIVIAIALRLRKKASKAIVTSEEKREVEINVEEVEELCNQIYEELDNVLGKDS